MPQPSTDSAVAGRHSLSVLVPVRNEAGNLRRAYAALRQVLDACPELSAWELLFIDDGSSDSSWDESLALADGDSRVRCLKLALPVGQHAALCAGMEAALGELLLTCDADLQVPPVELPRLWRAIGEGVDLVRGWRKERAHHSRLRRLLSFLTTQVVSLLLGRRYRDLTSPYAALRSELGRSLLKSGIRRHALGVAAVQIAPHVVELPVQHLPRVSGRSRYTWRSLLRLGGVMLATCFPAVPRRLAAAAGLLALLGVNAAAALHLGGFGAASAALAVLLGGVPALLLLSFAGLLHVHRRRLLRAEELPLYRIAERYPPS